MISGLQKRAEAEEAWREIREAVRRHDVRKVVSEIAVEHPIPTAELYAFGQAISRLEWPAGMRIAVLTDERYLNDCHFTETVVANRCALTSRGFADPQAAVAWLQADDA